MADCAGSQIVGRAAAKGWSASRGFYQGTPRPSPLSHLLPLPLMPAQAVRAVGRSAIHITDQTDTIILAVHHAEKHWEIDVRVDFDEDGVGSTLEVDPVCETAGAAS